MENWKRFEGRKHQALRPVQFKTGIVRNSHGSAEVSFGRTRVICTANLEEKAPPHAVEKGQGWLTAEYGMLPGSTGSRMSREASRGKQSGRTLEIQRLIGRSLRSVVDLKALANHTLWIDCDVIEADGGTRTAAITGAYVAVVAALKKCQPRFKWNALPILEKVAAVSCGVVGGEVLLDLDYVEDSNAQVDMNLVMTESGRLVEVQATGEGSAFSEEQFESLKNFAKSGIQELFQMQQKALEI